MIIIIGIINGGLGMQLAGIVKWRVVAYSVIAGAFCLSWLGLAIFRATASHRWTPRNLERAVDAQGVLGGSADADGQRNVSDAGQSYHTAATTETGTEMKESSTRQVKARPQSIAW